MRVATNERVLDSSGHAGLEGMRWYRRIAPHSNSRLKVIAQGLLRAFVAVAE